MASINGSNGGGGGGGNNNNNHNNDDVSMAYDGTPPDSHDANRSPSGVTTPGGGQGEASSTPYMAVQNGRKRKADGTSSRGVANLTPEQLAKKRANDREAQRAIRERTKNTIENLERRIKELESQQPFQELQNVIRLKDAVLAENEDLKRRMQSILALLQPLAGPQGLNGQSRQYPTAHIIALADGSDLAAATARQSPLPMAPPPQAQMYHAHQSAQPAAQSQSQSQSQIQTQTQIQQQQQAQAQAQAQAQQQHAHPQQYDAAFAQHHLHPDLRNNHASPSPQRPLPPSANGLGLSHGHGQQQQQQHDMRRWSPSLAPSPGQYNAQPQPQLPLQPQLQQLPSPSTASASASQHAPPAATYPPDATQQQQQQPDRFGLHHLVDHQPKPSSPSAIDARRRDLIPTASDEPPLYKRLPLNTEPTCTLDGILRGFEAERRRAAQSGTPAATLVGPSYPSISSLLNPTRAANSHPLSKVFTDILSRFPSISEVPEQIAVLYIMFLIMRWHIAPTQENYDRLPEWARPVKSQLEIAHPAWIDHLPWPTMRDRIIRAPSISTYPFDSFFVPYTTTMSLNWPYEHSQCLLPTAYNKPSHNPLDGPVTPLRQGSNDASAASSAIETALHGSDDGEEFVINPVFESHLRNLDNWSLGTPFKHAFPDLAEDVRVRDARAPVPLATS